MIRTLDQSSLEYTDRQILPSANFRLLLVSMLAAAIGIAAGVIAYLLYNLIALITNLAFYQRLSLEFVPAAGTTLGWVVIVVPVVGALIIGLMAKYGSSKIRGHGIPEAMEAVLTERSRIEPKVAVLKPLSAAIAIGTGGPFGAEGPIIQTGGAIGSLVGQAMHTTPAERKVLLACGAAAGMAATFSTPIAGVILAIELLLFEFKSRSFIPLVIASTLATAVHFQLFGRGPMFEVGALDFSIPGGLPWYILLGPVCGLAAVGFTRVFYWVEDRYEQLPLDPMWWPAIGAVGLGVIALFVPQVLGVGYDVISDILNNRLTLDVLLLVMVFKALALIIYLGSGTSGGLLAPMFVAAAAMGAIFAIAIDAIMPGTPLDPGAFALVSMAAVFGAASRATFTFIIFAFEITRDYDAVLPLMLVSVIADGVALLFLRNSIMTEKLARRGVRVLHDYEADVLQQMTVAEVMERDTEALRADTTVTELADRIARHDPPVSRTHGIPLIDAEGLLVGVITRGDVLRAIEKESEEAGTALEAGTDTPVVTYPDEVLSDAVSKMLRNDVASMPVIRRDEPRLLGWLTRATVLHARFKRIEDEHLREPGWLSRRNRRLPTG